MRLGSVAVVLVLACALPRIAAAASEASLAEGRRLFDEGRRHYELHEYEESLAAFKRAYVITDEPALLHDIALCLQQLGRNPEAADFFRSFLKRSPHLKPHDRTEIEELIRDLEAGRRELLSTQIEPLPPAPSGRVPIYKRWWLWTAIAGGVVVSVSLGVGLGVGLHNDHFDATRPGITFP